MAKTKEELDALKEEINKVNEKICELTPEELEQVAGGNSADFNVKDWNNYSISEKPLL